MMNFSEIGQSLKDIETEAPTQNFWESKILILFLRLSTIS